MYMGVSRNGGPPSYGWLINYYKCLIINGYRTHERRQSGIVIYKPVDETHVRIFAGMVVVGDPYS